LKEAPQFQQVEGAVSQIVAPHFEQYSKAFLL
jgi:hypothetical protein